MAHRQLLALAEGRYFGLLSGRQEWGEGHLGKLECTRKGEECDGRKFFQFCSLPVAGMAVLAEGKQPGP